MEFLAVAMVNRIYTEQGRIISAAREDDSFGIDVEQGRDAALWPYSDDGVRFDIVSRRSIAIHIDCANSLKRVVESWFHSL